jgi:hypothetical protein
MTESREREEGTMKRAIGTCLVVISFVAMTCSFSSAGVFSARGKVFGPDGTTPLPGDGLPITGPEGYVQCIYAGTGGTADPPSSGGLPGGDDALLETAEYPGQFFTAIGEGFPFSPNGRFYEDFTHDLPAGAKVYIRVWNGQAPSSSTHYGESGLFAVTAAAFQEHDFGEWSTTVALSACNDQDGDGYGNPASEACPFPTLDCNDSNPNVNPGRPEIPGNGMDDDCTPGTPPWGTPASTISENREPASRLANMGLLILIPGAVVILWKRRRRRG